MRNEEMKKQPKHARESDQACNEPSIKQIKYGFFSRDLNRCSSTLVCCPECQKQMTIRHFYSKHAAQKYNLDCRKQCLFCFGRKHWPYGQKNRPENVNHVTACLQRFVEDGKINEETNEMETEEEVCGCRHFRPEPHGMRGRRKKD
ncbi:uncharacterized protein TNCV_991141 [Trichonephila clavipes]|nr:uncharacterized protein TNCV_991141 [Trichonephila clavipes]